MCINEKVAWQYYQKYLQEDCIATALFPSRMTPFRYLPTTERKWKRGKPGCYVPRLMNRICAACTPSPNHLQRLQGELRLGRYPLYHSQNVGLVLLALWFICGYIRICYRWVSRSEHCKSAHFTTASRFLRSFEHCQILWDIESIGHRIPHSSR